jgi:hypothetical protein
MPASRVSVSEYFIELCSFDIFDLGQEKIAVATFKVNAFRNVSEALI